MLAFVLLVAALRLVGFILGKVGTTMAKAAGLWIGSCIADFKRAVEDSVLHESFATGPCEHFKWNRIPWSYHLENNEEYKVIFGRRLSVVGSIDESAQSTAESSEQLMPVAL